MIGSSPYFKKYVYVLVHKDVWTSENLCDSVIWDHCDPERSNMEYLKRSENVILEESSTEVMTLIWW